MSDLLVVSGPPGSGKSTISAALAARLEPCALVEADAFFAFLRGGIEPWTPEAARQNEIVIGATAAAAGRFVDGGLDVVCDGVVGPWFLPTLIAGTGLGHIDYVVLLPTVEVCLQRVAVRRGHGFTDPDATRHMHDQFASAAIDGRHLLDSTASIERLVDQVLAARADGTFRWSVAS